MVTEREGRKAKSAKRKAKIEKRRAKRGEGWQDGKEKDIQFSPRTHVEAAGFQPSDIRDANFTVRNFSPASTQTLGKSEMIGLEA